MGHAKRGQACLLVFEWAAAWLGHHSCLSEKAAYIWRDGDLGNFHWDTLSYYGFPHMFTFFPTILNS